VEHIEIGRGEGKEEGFGDNKEDLGEKEEASAENE
jgi:hypothetical protein